LRSFFMVRVRIDTRDPLQCRTLAAQWYAS
jgi:hypothetical protein